MPSRPLAIPKVRRSCELFLHDGTHIRGEVFIEVTQRIQDLLNDERNFFPFSDNNGTVQFIAKSSIMRVIAHD